MVLTHKTFGSGGLLCLLAASLSAQPAIAQEMRSGAFAGAGFRLELGARAKPPAARLQLGMRSLGRDGQIAGTLATRHAPALEIGVAGKESGTLFISGQSKADVERKLGLSAGTPKIVWIGLTVALVVVGTIVLINLDNLGDASE